MSLIYHHGVTAGRINLNRFVELTSTAAAKIFGLFPRKGTIAVGSDADIVIFDPQREETISVHNPRTHHMNIDYSAYEGFKVKGYTETVLSRGKVVIDRGEYAGRPGDGLLRQAGTVRGNPRMSGNGTTGSSTGGSPLYTVKWPRASTPHDPGASPGFSSRATSAASSRSTSTTRSGSSSRRSNTWRTARARTLPVP